jgi:hypothetical protein
MALAISFLAESLVRCLRSHVSRSATSGRLCSLRTCWRSCGGLPAMSRSMANSASIRSTASIAIGALASRARSKNLRRACALSGAPDKAHYLEHIFMWSGCVLTGFWRLEHITSGGRTPHNPHSVGDYRRVRGQHCRFRCGRGRRLRRTSPTGNGVMPTCQHARCTHLAAAPFPATAAMRA